MASPAQIPPVRVRRSFAGPVVLIVVGILLLLANMGSCRGARWVYGSLTSGRS